MTQPTNRRLHLLVSAVVAASVVALLVASSLRRIWTVDYWWQHGTGQYVAEQGVPRTEVFSYTNPEHQRLELRWGYCLALYKLTAWLGHGAAVVAKVLIVLAIFAVMVLTLGGRGPPVTTGAVVAVAALAANQRFFVRPELVSYLMVVSFMAIVERTRRGRTRWIYALPGLQVIWVNCHGLFLIGPALPGIWLAAESAGYVFDRRRGRSADPDRRRRLNTAILALVATLLAGLANPYFHRAYVLPILQFFVLHGTAQKEFFVELRSTFSFSQDYTALFYYEVLVGLAVLSAILNWRRQQLYWVLLVGSQLYLSGTAIRNLPLFCLVAVPYVVRNLTECGLWQRLGRQRLRWALRGTAAGALVCFCVYQCHALYTNRFPIKQGDTNQFGIGLADHRYPIEAVDFLKRSGVEGPIFHTPGIGSYLLAQGFLVFIDPRGEIYMDRIIDEYLELLGNIDRLPNYVDRYGFRAIVLETQMLEPINKLHRRGDWRLVYADAQAVVFFRADTAPDTPVSDLIEASGRWFTRTRASLRPPAAYADRAWLTRLTAPTPYLRLARLCALFDQHRPARTLFEDALAAYPPLFDAYAELARSVAATGDQAGAASYWALAADRKPDDVDVQMQTALACVRAGSADRARPYVEAVIQARPNDADALALRGIVALQLGNATEAVAWLRQAVNLQPKNAVYHRNLAKAHFAGGQIDAAIDAFEVAAELDPTDATVARDLARIFLSQDRREEAKKWVNRFTVLEPESPQGDEFRRALKQAEE
ncbi:MAG: tetratricopeptide repeat protein [bacterium]|nr:tetratricopeptide repeat protein [bacterium]